MSRRSAGLAFVGYALLSFLFFGLWPTIESGNHYIGLFDDPQIPIWSFGWWLHAIDHGDNPLVTHFLWAPNGVNLAWANTVPVLAVVALPLTWLLGPVAAFNVVAVMLPAVAAWSAFLLARYVTRQLWPSLFAGYLFGFSSYEIGHVLGQPQLTAVFVLPLAALVVLRHLDGETGRRRLAVELGLMMALQLWLSMELAFTITLALIVGLALAYWLVRDRRDQIASALRPLIAAFSLAVVLASPLLYFAFKGLRKAGFQPPEDYVADLANLVIPTHLESAGAGWTHGIVQHFPGNYSEQGAFIGLPVLAIVVAYAWRRWHSPATRFLVASLVLATYLSFGPSLIVFGHKLFPLPTPFGHDAITIGGHKKELSILNNTLPVRFALYASLASAMLAALWVSTTAVRRSVRIGLPLLAVLLLVPNPAAGVWSTRYSIPPFFTDSRYRSCLALGENVLPQPIGGGGQFMLWQVVDDFRFSMAGGRIQTSPPTQFLHPPWVRQITVGYPPAKDQRQLLLRYFQFKHVTSVIVDKREASIWAPALDKLETVQDVGGVLVYRISGPPRSCP